MLKLIHICDVCSGSNDSYMYHTNVERRLMSLPGGWASINTKLFCDKCVPKELLDVLKIANDNS